MGQRYALFKGIVWFVCVYHMLIGVAALGSPALVTRVASFFAGTPVALQSQALYLFKPFGVYLLAFGIAMGIAAWNPVKNRAILTVGVLLFALRIVQRLVFQEEMAQVFGVPENRNVMFIMIVGTLGLLLAVFRYRIYADMHQAPVR